MPARTIARVLVAALALTLLAPATGTAQSPEAGAGAERFAFAVWMRFGKNPGGYVAVGRQHLSPDEPGLATEGGAGRFRCRERRRHLVCTARVRMRDVGATGFQMDPLMESAHLEVPGKRRTVVDWTARDGADPLPNPMAVVDSCCRQTGAFGGADLSRPARAEGRVFGRRQRGGPSFGYLSQGAGGGAWMPVDAPVEAFVWVSRGAVFVAIFLDA